MNGIKARIAITLLVATVVMTGAAGCNGGSSNTSDASSSRETKTFTPTSTTIKVAWLQQYWESKEDLQFLFDGFGRLYPEYTLDIDYSLAETSKLLAAILSGDQPDLYLGADGNWATYSTGCYQRVFQPLEEYLAYDPDYNFDTVPKAFLDATTFYPDGRHYGLPYFLSAYCLSYNRTLFENAGIDPDSPPQTWSEWLEVNNKLILTDSNGVVTQLGMRWDAPYDYIISPLRKHAHISEDGLHSRYNEAWVVDDSLFISRFNDKYNEILPSGVEFSITAGNVGMDENTNLFNINNLTTSGLDIDIALLPHPDDFEERVVPYLLWQYIAIPTGASNPNGGWLFAKYACTDGMLAAMAKTASENPKNFTPQYIYHTPTRERAYNLYMNKVDAKTKLLIDKRDALIEQINYLLPSPPVQSKLQMIYTRWGKKYSAGEVTISGYYEGVHTELEQEFATWRSEMSAQGWNFPAEGKPFWQAQ